MLSRQQTVCASFVALSLSLSGCGKKEEEKEVSELDGTWKTACISKESDGQVESYYLATLKIDGTDATYSESSFAATDSTCTGAADYTIDSVSTFKVGADLATPAGAKELDQTPTKVTATLKTQATVDAFNENKLCGASDWALNTTKDVTTATCGGPDEGAMNKVNYDIYDVDGSTLKLGENDATHDGRTTAKRPVALSVKDDVYTKQ